MSLLRRALLLFVSILPVGLVVAAEDGAAGPMAASHQMVLDPNASFSVQDVLYELDGVEPLTAPDSAERGRVMQLRSFVENKGGRGEDTVRHGEEALRIETMQPFLNLEDRVSLHYAIARQDERLGRCEAAIPHYRTVLPLMAQDGVSQGGQLGTRQRVATCHGSRRSAASLSTQYGGHGLDRLIQR